jgi:hypothetical protein
MNKEQMVERIRNVVARVLEDASFVFSDELQADARPDLALWDAEGVALSFTGEKSGVFRIWTDKAFAMLLAANMLGVDTSSPTAIEKGNDALKEMVNIIVGNALTELFGEVAVFNLGIPEKAEATRQTIDCGRDDAIWLAAEEYKVLCVIDIIT